MATDHCESYKSFCYSLGDSQIFPLFSRIAQWMAKAYGYAAKKKEAYKSKEVLTLLLV